MAEKRKYFVYILRCSDGTFYTGKTLDLEKRIKAHNGEIQGGAKYTRQRRPVKIQYYETFKTQTEALKREYMLKQLSRKEKEKLIRQK